MQNEVSGHEDLWQPQPRYEIDREFYEAVRKRAASRTLVARSTVEPLHGTAFAVRRGQVLRIALPEGAQITELAMVGLENPMETYGAMRNRIWEGIFVGRYTRLWSEVPWLRPMMTCIEDTVGDRSTMSRLHDHRFWAPCSRASLERRFGLTPAASCRANLSVAIASCGMDAPALAEDLVLFDTAYLSPETGKICRAPNAARKGDYVEFFAEIDLLVAVSSCPLGDGSNDLSGPDQPSARVVGVEIFDTGVVPQSLATWTDWRLDWHGQWTPPNWWLGGA